MTTLDDLEEMLADIMPGFYIKTDRNGQLIIYTNLAEEDGELISLDGDDEDFDPDFEPLEEDEDLDEED